MIDIIPTGFIPLSSKGFLEKAKENDASLGPVGEDTVSINIPLIHATTLDRAMDIIGDGKLFSYTELKRSSHSSVSNNINNNTDVLDNFLGFDDYVFASLGKISPDALDLCIGESPVFFTFDANVVLIRQGVIGAIKEIAELGAWVSYEAGEQAVLGLGKTQEIVQLDNKKAIEEFYKKIYTAPGIRYLIKCLIDTNPMFMTDITFPGEELEYINTNLGRGVSNYWQGMQFMIPRELSLESLKTISCFSIEDRNKLARQIGKNKPQHLKGKANMDIVYSLKKVKSEIGSLLPVGSDLNHILINFLLFLIHQGKVSRKDVLNFFQ